MQPSRRTLSLVTAALLSVPLAVSAQPAAVATRDVHITDFAFRPQRLAIAAGEQVRFVNDDAEPHTVTATANGFDSGGLDEHAVWLHTFGRAGTFTYFCALHPYMRGTIVVAGRSGVQQ